MFNLCILQAGPINKKLVQDYPSYDKMFSLLLNEKIQFWKVDVYNIYDNIFPEKLTLAPCVRCPPEARSIDKKASPGFIRAKKTAWLAWLPEFGCTLANLQLYS